MSTPTLTPVQVPAPVEPFTIEQFYKYMQQGKLMGGICQKCKKVHLPPRPYCDSCGSQQFSWINISGKGKLLTYTVINVAPAQFQNLTPYAVGIVELAGGLRIPGMIQGSTTGPAKNRHEFTGRFRHMQPTTTVAKLATVLLQANLS